MIGSRAAQTQLLTGWGGFLFLFGKILRFLLFFVLIFSVLSKTNNLAGFNREQVLLFFLVFNLVDVSTQSLFRGVYRFRREIISGDYDLELVRPLPSFFRPIFGWTDIFDIMTLFPLWGYFFWFIFKNSLLPNPANLAIFFLLFLNSLILGFAVHLLICAICVLTTEIDHLVFTYRDLANMARFPTDIYTKGVQTFLTFIVPIIIMMNIPAKSLIGVLSWQTAIVSVLLTIVFFFGSVKLWHYALSQYSSASS